MSKHPFKYSLCVIFLTLILSTTAPASAEWWNSDFDSLSTVTLNTSAYQDDTHVHLSSDNFDIPLIMWLNINQDGNDTRILHTDNTTVFPIWIDHITARDNYSIWVNITDTSTATNLLWYYGNSTANTVSNSATTFIQFHDDATSEYHDPNIISPNSYIYETKTKPTSASFDFHVGVSETLGYTDDSAVLDGYSDTKGYSYNNGVRTDIAYGSALFSDGIYSYVKIAANGTVIDYYVNDTQLGTPISTNLADENMGLHFKIYTGTAKQDWSFVRKYTPATPTITAINLTVVTNVAPTTPILIAPTNTSYITFQGPAFLNVSSTDVDGDPITYHFYGGINPDTMSFLGNNDSVGGSSYNWTNTLYDVYYWTCFADDEKNTSANMSTAQYTLLVQPNLTSPINTSITFHPYPPLTSTISFTWQDTNSPQYRLMVAEDEHFNIMSADIHVGTNNSVQSLLVNIEYFWKVYSYDGSTYSDSSDVFLFNLTGNSTLTGSAIEGVVYQSNGDITAISGAEVTIWNTTWSDSMITGSNGYYVFEDLKSGTIYNLQAKSDRYWDSSIALVSAEDNPVTNNFYLIDDLTDTEWWHYVEFTLQSVWGVTYPNVATNVYIGDSPTISESGNTGSDGTISFHLNQNVQYHITFVNYTLGINEDITLYPVATSYTVYIDSYSFDLPNIVTDDIQAYIVSSRINATHGYINFTWSDTSGLTTSINYYISDVDGNELYSTSNSGPDMFNSQIVAATDDRYIVRYIGIHPIHETIDKTEPVVFHGGRRVDLGWDSDWQYAVTALAFTIFIGALFGAKTAHYGAIAVVIFAFIFKWIGWLNETNTSTLLIILAAVIAFGWALRKSEEVKV